MAGLAAFWRGRIGRGLAACAVIGAVAAVAAVSHGATTGVGLLKVRLGGDATQTRLVVELDSPAQGKLILPDDPAKPTDKVTLALPHVDVAGDMQGGGAGLIKSWTVDKAAGAARVQLQLVRPALVKRRFLLAPGDGISVYRYVIDLSTDGVAAATAAASAPLTTAGASPMDRLGGAARTPDKAAEKAPEKIDARFDAPLQPVLPSKKVVVIDAGHGGKDPGAGGSDSHEKDATLAAARALRDRLERSGRYKVVMTRETDVFIPLEQRVQIARRANADLFISLHADSGTDSSIRGATVYTLSDKGADRVAKHVIDQKNDWFMNVSLPGTDPSVNRILLDLTQRGTVNRSASFAKTLLERISGHTPLLQHGHRDAGFMVLLAPDVPAVLLEMGFITNKEDERLLNDPAHRHEVMDAVGDAIDAYFAEEMRFALK